MGSMYRIPALIRQIPRRAFTLILALTAFVLILGYNGTSERVIQSQEAKKVEMSETFRGDIKPLLCKYCLDCHSTKAKKGSLDLERFGTLEDIRKDVKPWQQMIELLETAEMPPKDQPQPSNAEKKWLVEWVRRFLDDEARTRRCDPGHVPLRRLSNAEYDATIHDLKGINLRPTCEFPADGAAGEGFTNAAESLSDISPALFNKYLNAARDIADHAVLLPEGFHFSPSKTRRDWSDEGVAKLRAFDAPFAPADGKLAFQPYLLATIRHREALRAGSISLGEVAAKDKLNATYLTALWTAFNDKAGSYPLREIIDRWNMATGKDVATLTTEITSWQSRLWQTARIGNYLRALPPAYTESLTRQIPNDPKINEAALLRLAIKPAPGQNEVVLYLVSQPHGLQPAEGTIIWQAPRFEAAGKPTLQLAEYPSYAAAFAIDYGTVFANSARYLHAVAEAHKRKLTTADAAREFQLEESFLKRWQELLGLTPLSAEVKAVADREAKPVPAVPRNLLSEKMDKVQEGERTLLDNCMLLYCSSMMTGHHNNDQLPVVMVGRSGGRIKTGRILDYLGKPNRKMCSLYLSLMDKAGVRLKEFGDLKERLAEI